MCGKYFLTLTILDNGNCENFQTTTVFQITVHMLIYIKYQGIFVSWLYGFIPNLLYINIMVLLCVEAMPTVSSFLRQMSECVAYGSAATEEMKIGPSIYEDLELWTESFDFLRHFMTFAVI